MEYIKCENCGNKGKLNPVDGTPMCESCSNPNKYNTENENEYCKDS